MIHELQWVVQTYGLGELRSARRAEQGFVNDNWIVEADHGRFFVKRRHPDLSQPSVISAQHELMRELRRAGFPAPVVLCTPEGESFVILDSRVYEVQQFIPGERYDHERPEHLAEASRILGRYHQCGVGSSPHGLYGLGDLYGPTLLEDGLRRLNEFWGAARDPELVPLIERLMTHTGDLAQRYACHGYLPSLVIHGDFYADNLLFDRDRIVGVVDYDKARWQPRVVELAEALIYFASPRPGRFRHLVYSDYLCQESSVAFLQGYCSMIALTDDEATALPDIIRCIWMQVSLQWLAEQPMRSERAPEALREAVALGDWAVANARWVSDAVRAATAG